MTGNTFRITPTPSAGPSDKSVLEVVAQQVLDAALGSLRTQVARDLVASLKSAGVFGRHAVEVGADGEVSVRLASVPHRCRCRRCRVKKGEA